MLGKWSKKGLIGQGGEAFFVYTLYVSAACILGWMTMKDFSCYGWTYWNRKIHGAYSLDVIVFDTVEIFTLSKFLWFHIFNFFSIFYIVYEVKCAQKVGYGTISKFDSKKFWTVDSCCDLWGFFWQVFEYYFFILNWHQQKLIFINFWTNF